MQMSLGQWWEHFNVEIIDWIWLKLHNIPHKTLPAGRRIKVFIGFRGENFLNLRNLSLIEYQEKKRN